MLKTKYLLPLILILLLTFTLTGLADEERQSPDGETFALTELSGAYTDVDEDPDSPDGNWLPASGNNTNTAGQTSFPTPTGNPTEGAGLQEFRVLVRQYDEGQTGTPEARIELWEDGLLVRAGDNTNVTQGGVVLSFTWNANELGTADGSLVECNVVGTKTGGSPSTRNTVEIGAIEWNVVGTKTGGSPSTRNTVEIGAIEWNVDYSSPPPPPGNGSPWLSGWDYRIELEIGDYAGDIGAEVVWFPVTVFLTNSQCEEVFVELTTDAEYNLVAFTKADAETELYAECELFDASAEKGIYHVSRDGWTINDDTSIFLYYDADHAPNAFIGAITARTEVWDGNFEFVCHMVDDNGNVDDSTSNNNDGTKLDTDEPNEVTGKVGQGQDFDGTDDDIVLPSIGSFDTISIEAIIKIDTFADEVDKGIVGSQDWSAGKMDFGYTMIGTTANKYKLQFDIYSVLTPISNAEFDLNAYYYFAGTYDKTGTSQKMYYNDTLDRTITSGQTWYTVDLTNLDIGDFFSSRYTNGIIDEVRISSNIRTPAWLKGTYNSLWDALFTYGSEEAREVVTNVMFMFSNF